MSSEEEFVGWLPNVAGRVSFSHIGQTRHPAPCTTVNEDDDHGRVILCSQRRVLSDALISPKYLKFVYGYDPSWVFVFLASSAPSDPDRIGKLSGSIFMFNLHRWREGRDDIAVSVEDNQDRSPRAIVQFVLNALDGTDSPSQKTTSRAAQLRAILPQVADLLEQKALLTISCEISRLGFAKFTARSLGAEILFASSVTSVPAEIGPEEVRYINNQAYFFVKDICHHHRHHHPRSDTITTAHRNDEKLTWLRETKYSIHRRLVSIRRSDDPSNLYDALGLLAYLSSLEKVAVQLFDQVIHPSKKTPGAQAFIRYQIPEIAESLKSKIEAKRWLRIQWNIIITAIPAIFISTSALLVAKTATEESTLFQFTRAMLEQTFPLSIYGALAFSFVLAMIPVVYGALDPRRSAPFHNAKRIFVVLRRRTQASLWNSLALFNLLVASCLILISFILPGGHGPLAWNTICAVMLLEISLISLLPYLITLPDLIRRLRGQQRFDLDG